MDNKMLQGKELEQFKDNFKIISYWAPTIFTSPIDNQKYAIAIGSPWIPIPHAMTLQEVSERWIKKELKKPEIIQRVPSKRGKGEYTVTFDKSWKCTCSGYKFKRNCSHIDDVKSKLKLKLK